MSRQSAWNRGISYCSIFALAFASVRLEMATRATSGIRFHASYWKPEEISGPDCDGPELACHGVTLHGSKVPSRRGPWRLATILGVPRAMPALPRGPDRTTRKRLIPNEATKTLRPPAPGEFGAATLRQAGLFPNPISSQQILHLTEDASTTIGMAPVGQEIL